MRVFVSYRRDDVPDATDRLTEDLRERFGEENVFIDIDSIEIGADFADVIADWVARADAFLAVIGRNWIDARRPDGQRRIDDPGDYVRIEIEAALRQNQRVVPVLIHGATIPAPSELPATVAPLMRRNAVELSRRYWEEDIRGLIAALERIPRRRDSPSPSLTAAPVAGLAGERTPAGGAPVAIPDDGHRHEAAPVATATAGQVPRDDEVKITIEPVVPVTAPIASGPSTLPDAPAETGQPKLTPEPTRQAPRRSWGKLGALAAGLAAVIAVVVVATSGGGGGGHGGKGGGGSTGNGHGSATQSAKSVVDHFFNAYNRGDNGTAAQLWAPAINETAVYRPGYPAHAPLQHLTTIAAVQSSVLSHGCQRSSYSAAVSGDMVTTTYWSYGQRPGQVKCTAGNQHWQDVFTVDHGHIVRDISTRLR